MQATLCRHSVALFRYGGEEFVVILEDVAERQTLAVAERIIVRVRSLRLPHPDSAAASHVAVSIGVAVARREKECSGRSWWPARTAPCIRPRPDAATGLASIGRRARKRAACLAPRRGLYFFTFHFL